VAAPATPQQTSTEARSAPSATPYRAGPERREDGSSHAGDHPLRPPLPEAEGGENRVALPPTLMHSRYANVDEPPLVKTRGERSRRKESRVRARTESGAGLDNRGA